MVCPICIPQPVSAYDAPVLGNPINQRKEVILFRVITDIVDCNRICIKCSTCCGLVVFSVTAYPVTPYGHLCCSIRCYAKSSITGQNGELHSSGFSPVRGKMWGKTRTATREIQLLGWLFLGKIKNKPEIETFQAC